VFGNKSSKKREPRRCVRLRQQAARDDGRNPRTFEYRLRHPDFYPMAPSSARRCRLLILHLQFVDDLLDIGDLSGHFFDFGAFGLRVDGAAQSNYSVFDIVFYSVFESVFYQDGM
jgi:hypothetical protein